MMAASCSLKISCEETAATSTYARQALVVLMTKLGAEKDFPSIVLCVVLGCRAVFLLSLAE